MILVGITQCAADTGLDVARRHLPDGTDIGSVISASTFYEGQPYTVLQARHGYYFAADAGHHLRFLRRLDSPLGEPWDTTEGRMEEITYVLGEQVARTEWHITITEMDQAAAAHRNREDKQ